MKWNITKLQTRLYLITAIVLLVGLGSAILIYLTAGNASDSDLVYEFEHSKKYVHDLELYGGKVSVLANELSHWFAGLWRGTSLALTVACITILVSFGLFFVAYHLPPDSKSDARGEHNRDRTD